MEEIRLRPNIPKLITAEYERAVKFRKNDDQLEPPIVPEEGLFDVTDCLLLMEQKGNRQVLSPDDLQAKLRRMSDVERLSKGFKEIYVPGQRIWLMPAPTDGYGCSVAETLREASPVIRLCFVLPNGLTYGFTKTPAFYYPMYPEEIRDASFIAPVYADQSPIVTDDEYDRVLIGYKNAYDKLMKLGF